MPIIRFFTCLILMLGMISGSNLLMYAAEPRAKLDGCYLLHYSAQDLNPAEERSFEGYIRGSTAGIWAPFMQIVGQGDGKEYQFCFFNKEKIFSASSIEKTRNEIQETENSIRFIVCSHQNTAGIGHRQSNEIVIKLIASGDLTVKIVTHVENRLFYLYPQTQTHEYNLHMTRIELNNVPQKTGEELSIAVPGPKQK